MPSQKKERCESKSNSILRLAVCQLFLISLPSYVQAQVILVPNSPRTPKIVGKSKTRPRQKPVVSSAVSAATASKPVSTQNVASDSPRPAEPPTMGFPIVKPLMLDMAMPRQTTATEPTTTQITSDNGTAEAEKQVARAEVKAAESEIKSNKKPVEDQPANNSETKRNVSESQPEVKVENVSENRSEVRIAEGKPPASTPAGIKETISKLPMPEKLFSYTFDITITDLRGKVSRTGKETRRYFSEELPGGIALEMVEITGGVYVMGSSDQQLSQNEKAFSRDLRKQTRERVQERLSSETPQHVVKVPGYFIGKFEVTQSQWRAVASLPKVKKELMSDPSQFKGGNLPIESISWEEAVEFCERLSRATGRKYRLPTEAEWEYACRAGSDTAFHFGQTITTEVANFDGKRPFLTSPEGENRQKSLPAGSFGAPNAFGLYDMHGNVREWCLDNWHENYRSAPGDGSVWQKEGVPYLKVLRGGGWDNAAVECRSGFRDRLTPTLKMSNTGFRVVMEVPSQP